MLSQLLQPDPKGSVFSGQGNEWKLLHISWQITLCLSFLTWTMRIIIVETSQGCWKDSKVDAWEMHQELQWLPSPSRFHGFLPQPSSTCSSLSPLRLPNCLSPLHVKSTMCCSLADFSCGLDFTLVTFNAAPYYGVSSACQAQNQALYVYLEGFVCRFLRRAMHPMQQMRGCRELERPVKGSYNK